MDRRITPARDDLAADWLHDHVRAERYATGAPHTVVRDGAPLCFSPEATAGLESQLIYGEIFQVYDERDGWCWGQNLTDGYVGYVPSSDLTTGLPLPDHQVAALHAHLYTEPDLKRPTAGTISMSARVKVVDISGRFCRTASGHWLHSRHLVSLEYGTRDVVGTAMKFIGVPYLWGGRTAQGVDCSSLVQLALAMAGIAAPRDSDLQEAGIGEPVAMNDDQDFSHLEEGDLVFFPGHVGLFVEDWRFLHANAFDMQVSLHRFSDVLDRAERESTPVSSVRRITPSI
ncbi:MAG: C40 family peptidase [Rhodospirillaceae bacterium]|jgi:cell wall-associated NlpC family hydrolase|nr:C40 family peptidase [Rhodospirillaceae bacterium]MBT4688832.1 C40 family peptidase [Rhodospirillaceae bacterium]MBT5194120.1 C40 family peptidase [Rhodospirillaceae bacterium]MBT5898604.1 C40 family peptidase [Rhodospirillaceae bacterium]MBT6430903.1 C40 family peptidase [Rhodospirillaceae bacterium]